MPESLSIRIRKQFRFIQNIKTYVIANMLTSSIFSALACCISICFVNNTFFILFIIVETVISIACTILLFFLFIDQTMHKLQSESNEILEFVHQIAQVQLQVQQIEKLNRNIIATDVVCIDHYVYNVSANGEVMTVYYDDSLKRFFCKCKIYAHNFQCFHTNRARWLHRKIYRIGG